MQAQLDERLRDTFPAIVEPNEKMGTMDSKAIAALFSLHPDVLLKGYQVVFVDARWHIRNEQGSSLFNESTATACAKWLKSNKNQT